MANRRKTSKTNHENQQLLMMAFLQHQKLINTFFFDNHFTQQLSKNNATIIFENHFTQQLSKNNATIIFETLHVP